jgi:hypothetical protein
MRYLLVGLSLGTVLLATGCPNWSNVRNGNGKEGAVATAGAPPAADLVRYLNANAAQVPALEVGYVDIDAKAEGQPFGAVGKMVCERPRNFYLSAKMLGSPAAQIGSNSQEFWYWIKDAKPAYVYHCSYDDYNRGLVRAVQMPFQPEWLIDALGIAPYDENAQYHVTVNQKTVELSQDTVSPQGQPVRRVTVFAKGPAAVEYGKPQVLAHIVYDQKGNVICAAHTLDVQLVRGTRVVLPHKLRLEWPAEKMVMTLKLEDVTVTSRIDPNRAQTLFTRHTLAHLPGYDLARGEDRALGGIQPAGGSLR